jgi:ABC-2 type transport system ATP-binding protein
LSSANAIEVRGLRKSYGERVAVAGIDLHVARGEVFALLGPNGAGKTTTVEILEGHRERTSGEVSVLGYDPQRMERGFKERIGVVLQETGVEPYLTVRETLDMYRGYYPHPLTTDHMLELVGLAEQAETRVIRLSGGQQRRLDVAIGLAGDPELVFLDEPTTGFDPAARRGAWEMVRGLQDLGKTIFLTTHYMEEAEYLAGRVAIIRRGEIVAEGPPSSLVGADPTTTVRFRLPADASDVIAGIEGARVDAEGLVAIETLAPTALLYELTRRAQDRGVELPELSVARPSLEDTYLRLVGADEPHEEPPAPSSRRRRGRR